MHSKEILYKESRIKILTDKKELIPLAFAELVRQRSLLERYIKKDRFFETSLEPVKVPKSAPQIVKTMSKAGIIAGVGPMAAVAGTISELLSEKLISSGAKTAISENGGDIFAITETPVLVGLYVTKKPLTGKIAFRLDKKNTPLSICSSSSIMGHSLSFGDCDLATVFSKSGSISDASATALCNRVKKEEDIDSALNWVIALKGVEGALVIKNDKIGMIGTIPEMIRTGDKKIREKVTRFDNHNLDL
ncbi:MAG: UPF0280 family protein [archaeon]